MAPRGCSTSSPQGAGSARQHTLAHLPDQLAEGRFVRQAFKDTWDGVVQAGLSHSDMERTGDSVVTIALPAFSGYSVEAAETITVSVLSSAVIGTRGISSSNLVVQNDLWVWRELSPSGTAVPERRGHVAISFERIGKMIVFAGAVGIAVACNFNFPTGISCDSEMQQN